MGNIEQKPPKIQNDWEKVDTDNGIQIYRNKNNNELAEKRIITIDSAYDIEEEIAIYHMRQHNNDALVRTLGTQNLDPNYINKHICAGQMKFFVYTEKMPYRLSECPQLTFPETLLFLRESLKAFQRIFKEEGSVQITKQLIGINYLGQVKSWLNQNWALNHRGHQYLNLGSIKVSDLTREQYLAFKGEYMDETQMIKNLISVIEEKCEDGEFPLAFKEEVQNQSGSFRKLSLYLKDFIQYNQIYVPERIDYETLIRNNYRTRLEYQLNLNSQNGQIFQQKSGNVGNNSIGNQTQSVQYQQGVYGQENKFRLGDFSKNILPLSQNQSSNYAHNFQMGQKTQSIQYLASDKTKQSPISDTLGKITFSQVNRAYNEPSKGQGMSQKGTAETLPYVGGLNNYQWPSTIQGISKSNFQQPSLTSGQNYTLKNNTITTETYVSQRNYQPSVFQAKPLETNFQKKSESIINGLNGVTSDVKENKVSYFNSSNFSQLNNSSNFSQFGASSNLTQLGNIAGFTNQPHLVNYSVQGTSKIFLPQAATNIPPPTLIQRNSSFTTDQKILSAPNPVIIQFQNQDTVIRNIPKAVQYTPLVEIEQQKDVEKAKNKVNISKRQLGIQQKISQTVTNGATGREDNLESKFESNFSTFSFSNKIMNEKKIETVYTGTGYTNNLIKYEPLTNLNIQGKYTDAFNMVIDPKANQNQQNILINNKVQVETAQQTTSIRQENEKSLTSINENQPDHLDSPTDMEERKASMGQHQILTRTFEGFSNVVQRKSTEIAESIIEPN